MAIVKLRTLFRSSKNKGGRIKKVIVKEIFNQYALYNTWANEKIIESLSFVRPELMEKPVESSFPSLRLTVLHLWETEFVWWQRLHLAENIVFIPQKTEMPIKTIFSEWKRQSVQLQTWVHNLKDAGLSHVFSYQNSKKEQFKQPVFQVLLHVFNHNTYHRGQIITIFHQLGIEKRPATDFILWSRNAK